MQNKTKQGNQIYHRWRNLKSSGETTWGSRPQTLLHSWNILWWSGRCNREHRSATRFSTPAICWALSSTSYKARKKQISRRQSHRNSSLAAPELSTCTETMLSHKILMRLPFQEAPHSLIATTIANNSKELMLGRWAKMKSGNWAWKYCPSTQAPQPTRHASLDMTLSGTDHSSHGIMETPLYKGINLSHQATSFRASAGMETLPTGGVSRRKFNRRDTKTRPGRTQHATKWSLPRSTCRSCLLADMRPSQSSRIPSTSLSLSGVMVRDNSLVLNTIPRQTTTQAGGQALSLASTSPASTSTSPKIWKDEAAWSHVSAPIKSSR